MSAIPILQTGLCVAVGHHREAACAAMRTGITGFTTSRFMYDGEWIEFAEVPMERELRGREKLLEMSALAVEDALSEIRPEEWGGIRVILNIAEEGRPGRPIRLDVNFLADLNEHLKEPLGSPIDVIPGGRAGGLRALERAGEELAGGSKRVLILSVDSYLNAATLNHFYDQTRLLTEGNSDGFIPGEGAGAILVGQGGDLVCDGLGFGREKWRHEGEDPMQAEGLIEALRAALGGRDCSQIHFRICDHAGEQIYFKEGSLAMTRVVRPVREEFDVWHPADCIGEVGAVIVAAMLSTILMAGRKGYLPGPGILLHAGNDTGERAACTLRWEKS